MLLTLKCIKICSKEIQQQEDAKDSWFHPLHIYITCNMGSYILNEAEISDSLLSPFPTPIPLPPS